MNIIIDLDNTLFYNHVVDTVCALHSIPRGVRHDLTDLPAYAREECFAMFENHDVMGNLQPFKGAYKVVKKLLDMGHNVFIVTARDSNLEMATVAMVNKHLPKGVKVVIVGSYNKFDVYKELKADIVIDDHFEHIQQAKMAKATHVVMVSNNLTPYNHIHKDCVLNMGGAIVNSISEFGELFVKWQDHMDRLEYCNDVNMLLSNFDNVDEDDYDESTICGIV